MSTKLKLLGVDVASFGDAMGVTPDCLEVVVNDAVNQTYAKLVLSDDAKTLLGGILVGDASAYGMLRPMVGERAARRSAGADRAGRIRRRRWRHWVSARCRPARRSARATTSPRAICTDAIAGGCCDVPALKQCTQAGTSCGSCVPLLKQLLEAEGVEQSKALCEHFSQSRAELFEIVSATVDPDLLRAASSASAPERVATYANPSVASILASTSSEHILDGEQASLQDSNDHFLANIQKQRQLLGGAAGARRRHHARAADPDRRDRPGLRPVHQDHRRPAHRHVRRPGGPAARDLAPAGRRRHGIRPRLRQGAAHGEELRGQRLVPLRAAGFGADGDRPRAALPRPAGAAQDQDGRLGLRARVRGGPRQGRRRHRHRERLEPLRRRQRRHDAQARASCSPAISTTRRWSATSTAS